jgi:hydroxymethylpyrimidine pyrophosphatase-like HAD family hydrolase
MWRSKRNTKINFTIAKAGQALEITAGGVNKARTLNEYIAAKGIKPDEVAVVGDSFNDLPLIEAFKNSFVMSSGEEEVKPKARYIIKSVSDIREYVLNEDKTLKDNGI